MTTISITSEQKTKSDEISADTAAFIAAGGKIQQLPYGPDEYSETATVDLNAVKKEKARAKGMTQFNNRTAAQTTKKRQCKHSGQTKLAKKKHSQAVSTTPAGRARAKASGFKGEAA